MGLSHRLQPGYHIQAMVFGRHDQRIVATRAAAAGICAGHAASGCATTRVGKFGVNQLGGPSFLVEIHGKI